MAENSKYSKMSKEQVFSTLRREILAAQLKVELDKQLNRETSATVKRLANMKLPAIDRSVANGVDAFVESGTVMIPTAALEKSGFRVIRDPESEIKRRSKIAGLAGQRAYKVTGAMPKSWKIAAKNSDAATKK